MPNVRSEFGRVNRGNHIGIIAAWSPQKRERLEKELIEKVPLKDLVEKYGISARTIKYYKSNHMMPALAAAADREKQKAKRQRAIQHAAEDRKETTKQIGRAARLLDWLEEETKDSIRKVKDGHKVTAEDGTEKVVREDPKRFGTVAALLGAGFAGVRLLGELTGEFGGPKAPEGGTTQILNVINIPAYSGAVPEGLELPRGAGVDYSVLKAIDVTRDE